MQRWWSIKQPGWSPGTSPAMLVARCAHLFVRRNDEKFKRLGLSVTQLPVIVLLKHGGARTQGELARFAGVEQPSMAELLRRMERDGLVVRMPNPADGRSSLVRLTEKVMEWIEPALSAFAETSNGALDGFSPEEVETLRALLQRMVANLDGDER